MYLCDDCGFSMQKPGMCPKCLVPLTQYTKDIQADYQSNAKIEDAMRLMSEYQWYV